MEHNLPAPLTSLLGRGRELQGVEDTLRRTRLVTLTGPGGVGKTRLALHVAGRLADAFPDGIWLVRLEAIREVELVLATIAQAVGIADSSASDLAGHIANWLGPGRHLFLIDNFEQVADASPVLVDLLQRCPGLKLLVTSRMSLGVSGEREYPLGPLPLPDAVDVRNLGALLEYPAARLFVDRARVIGSGGGWIMRRHIFPNVMNLIVAQAVLTFATAVFTETTLAFIGLGDPSAPSWGQILNSAQTAGAPGLGAWWYIVPPAAAVVLVVMAFTLLGNALDDVLNPKMLSRR